MAKPSSAAKKPEQTALFRLEHRRRRGIGRRWSTTRLPTPCAPPPRASWGWRGLPPRKRGRVAAVTGPLLNDSLRDRFDPRLTVKDFRTWGGTLTAAITLAAHGPPASVGDAKKAIAHAYQWWSPTSSATRPPSHGRPTSARSSSSGLRKGGRSKTSDRSASACSLTSVIATADAHSNAYGPASMPRRRAFASPAAPPRTRPAARTSPARGPHGTAGGRCTASAPRRRTPWPGAWPPGSGRSRRPTQAGWRDCRSAPAPPRRGSAAPARRTAPAARAATSLPTAGVSAQRRPASSRDAHGAISLW
jgi:hypothetical protein